VRRAAALLLAALALAAAGCGDDDDGGGGAGDAAAVDLIERAFAADVESGVLTVDAELELDGAGQLEGPLRLELEGPFRGTGGAAELPDLDMEFSASGLGGQDVSGSFIVTRQNAWIEFGGETYEVGEELWQRALESLEAQQGEPETFAEAGVDPLDWLRDLRTEGEEEVDGVPTTKVSGRIDVGRMLRDLNKFETDPDDRLPDSTLDKVEEAVEDIEFEAWIDEDDLWRRISSEAEFEVPEAERDSFGGLEGGHVSLDIELDEPNEPVEIEGPTEARPFDELLRRLGIPPEQLLGPGFAVPTPG
jgi:hypothetical protein